MSKFSLGESPLWHSKNCKWMWTDILASRIYEMPIGNAIDVKYERQIAVSQMVSNLAVLNDGSLLVSAENCLMIMDSKTDHFETLVSLPHSELFRCNDGSVGPDGKYWFGTMEKAPTGLHGEIYSLDRQGKLVSQSAPIGIPNSFIWLDDFAVLITDSFLQLTFKVSLKKNGKLDWENRAVWLDLSDTDCTPDGGTIDVHGDIWLAIWGGAAIHKYSADGKLLDKIHLKALQPTSCAFGGPNMGTLLITTATSGLSTAQLDEYPDSGKVLQHLLPVKGKKVHNFNLEE
jgi:sugar lactone lactonase YvrE